MGSKQVELPKQYEVITYFIPMDRILFRRSLKPMQFRKNERLLVSWKISDLSIGEQIQLGGLSRNLVEGFYEGSVQETIGEVVKEFRGKVTAHDLEDFFSETSRFYKPQNVEEEPEDSIDDLTFF